MSAEARRGDLPDLLREIASMDRAQCQEAWARAFKTDPPKYISVSFMQRVLAYDQQCRQFGAHSTTTRRALKQVLCGESASDVAQFAGDGSTLVREWNGRVYRVDVLPDGYMLDGESYKSLSTVARHITGARWSGPRFFGLTGKRSA